jgi:hypothetical protein
MTAGDKCGPCTLCGDVSLRRQSHIIPEFLYKDLYDDKHRWVGLRPNRGPHPQQKGIREYLLCDSCEGRLSIWESYAAAKLPDPPDFALQRGSRQVFPDVDYERFKLFQLSLIWRASVARHRTFYRVELGPHEERIRQMLLEETPGEPWDYGCLMLVPSAGKLDRICLPFLPVRYQGHQVYCLLARGLIWSFFVSSHLKQFRGAEDFLSEQGELIIRAYKDTSEEMMRKLGSKLRQAGCLDHLGPE